MWNGLEAENTCKSCQLKWMLLYDHTLELENERVSREETVKESEYVANRHPPGRYARDHIYRVEYLYNWFRDYFRCKNCGAMDYKLRLETEEMNRSTIQVTPWVKEDNEGLAGARLGAKTSEWLLK